MRITRSEITAAIQDPMWQWFRENALKGQTLNVKLLRLRIWIMNKSGGQRQRARIQVQNYLNALRRSGMNVPDVEALEKEYPVPGGEEA